MNFQMFNKTLWKSYIILKLIDMIVKIISINNNRKKIVKS